MQALKLSSRQGWLWFTRGFALFRKRPGFLSLIIICYWLIVVALNKIPFVGAIVATLCLPAFSVSLMHACRELEQDRITGLHLLFSGFSENLKQLLWLGVLYLVASVCALAISALADGGVLMRAVLLGAPLSAANLADAEFINAIEIALLLLSPLMMAYWYAPVLVAWHDLPINKALFFSSVACLRNWRAFLGYGLATALFSIVLPSLLLILLASVLPFSINTLSSLITLPLIFVLVPTLFASFYISYREIFVLIDDEA
ncbi:MAG: BPSS1780 family membrane protein [Pseudomonadota bacterium]